MACLPPMAYLLPRVELPEVAAMGCVALENTDNDLHRRWLSSRIIKEIL